MSKVGITFLSCLKHNGYYTIAKKSMIFRSTVRWEWSPDHLLDKNDTLTKFNARVISQILTKICTRIKISRRLTIPLNEKSSWVAFPFLARCPLDDTDTSPLAWDWRVSDKWQNLPFVPLRIMWRAHKTIDLWTVVNIRSCKLLCYFSILRKFPFGWWHWNHKHYPGDVISMLNTWTDTSNFILIKK